MLKTAARQAIAPAIAALAIFAASTPAVAVSAEYDEAKSSSGPGASTSGYYRCAEDSKVEFCFMPGGDLIFVKDKSTSSPGAYVNWDILGGRYGQCDTKIPVGKWGVCNKNFPEGKTIELSHPNGSGDTKLTMNT